MARKPMTTEITPSVVSEIPQDLTEAANIMAAAATSYGEERDLLNQLLGQAKMADAMAKMTATVAVSKLKYVKENKLYQSLAGMKDRDGRGLTGTWDEFCKLLGTSAPKANEDINNLQSFGEQALESMSSMGIGYREMRQFRRLPEDQKAALIEVAKAGDKDSLLELAEDLIAKHTKEKDALTERAAAAEQELVEEREANARITQKDTDRIRSLERQLDKKQRVTPDEQLVELHHDLTTETNQAVAQIDAGLRSVFSRLSDHHEQNPGPRSDALMLGAIDQIQRSLIALREDFALAPPPSDDGVPEWQAWNNAQEAGLESTASAPEAAS